MKFRDAIPGALILALRLALVPPGRWALDWIVVMSLLWIGVTISREDSRFRNWTLGVACSWLAVIYAIHQAPWTFAGMK